MGRATASSARPCEYRLAVALGVAALVWIGVVAADGLVAAAQSKPTTAANSLEAAAAANAKAWLTGTPDDIKRFQGPECAPKKHTHATPAEEDAALKKLRAPLIRLVGRPLRAIKIQDVRVRNVTATTGEAEVEYDLPASVAGNYNWVTFKRHGSKWQVADCRLPIGGNVQNAVPATPTT